MLLTLGRRRQHRAVRSVRAPPRGRQCPPPRSICSAARRDARVTLARSSAARRCASRAPGWPWRGGSGADVRALRGGRAGGAGRGRRSPRAPAPAAPLTPRAAGQADTGPACRAAPSDQAQPSLPHLRVLWSVLG